MRIPEYNNFQIIMYINMFLSHEVFALGSGFIVEMLILTIWLSIYQTSLPNLPKPIRIFPNCVLLYYIA